MPTVTETFDAILFDMDGTLVSSTKGVIGAWHFFKETYPDLNVEEMLNTAHGVRTVDNLRIHCGLTDPKELESEACRFEEEIVNHAQKGDEKGIVALPGVREVSDSLLSREEGKNRWALCTSATKVYATSALQIAEIPHPTHFVAAEDVDNGKPAPDPYLKGAELCKADPKRCLVVEDAPAGIASGRLAGSKTLAVITSHTREGMLAAKPDFLVQNLASVTMKLVPEGVEVSMDVVE
ncbi:phosphatase [Phellopilus nigrolimitatus]|nr:phosphatase [Phellopilus nigrolimitatus]